MKETKEKFTKGEWSILATGTHWNNPKLMNLQITYGGIGECICETVYSEDDAHLIAASPNGFELGLLVMEICGHPSGVSEQQADLLYETALSFIKKARGK